MENAEQIENNNIQQTCQNELMNNVYPYLQVWMYRKGAIVKCNPYSKIYLGNSLNVCICLMTAKITDGSQWWQISITFIKCFYSKDCAAPQMPNPETE